MLTSRPGVVDSENWGKIFISIKDKNNKYTDKSNEVIKYINNNYQKYSEEFYQALEKNVNEFRELLEQSNCMEIKQKYRDIMKNLSRRTSYLKNLNIEDREYN